MRASAWSGGRSTFGIRVGAKNRDEFFDRRWTKIEVEINGKAHTFRLTPGFWHHCPEFRDSGGQVIQNWLRQHHTVDWPKGNPPRVELVPLGGDRFRLLALRPPK